MRKPSAYIAPAADGHAGGPLLHGPGAPGAGAGAGQPAEPGAGARAPSGAEAGRRRRQLPRQPVRRGHRGAQAQAPQRSTARRRRARSRSNICQPGMGAGGSPWGRPMGGGFLPAPCRRRWAWPAACWWPTPCPSAFSPERPRRAELARTRADGPAASRRRRPRRPSWDEPTPPGPDLPRDAGFDDPGFDDGGGDGSFDARAWTGRRQAVQASPITRAATLQVRAGRWTKPASC